MSAPAGHTPEEARGALAATLCYFLWGLVPLYWRQLAGVDPVELIAHRHLWSLALLLGVLAVQRRLSSVGAAFASRRSFAINALGAVLLTGNWLVYVWGVNTGHVIETSLGYFLVPLVNVAAGRFVLHEHLRRAQRLAIGLAALGVILMIVQLGRPPWIALALAGTWGGYSLLRKQSPLPAATGLAIETLMLAPLALAFLAWLQFRGVGAMGHADTRTHVLIMSSGVITAIPLLLFAYGARRIRLSTLGLLQYCAPSVQLVLGIWVFHEPFSRARIASFAFIWAALALYTADNLLQQRRFARA
ncbi:EamA family transporter RarD [Horticoccus sp. 23ND18S-11]|uniref:EamA family transporter RarD n=1 Tax=Horticoccus sp. 23ND18S-11 TaxID=3391832 RepID=UPI0039C95FE7